MTNIVSFISDRSLVIVGVAELKRNILAHTLAQSVLFQPLSTYAVLTMKLFISIFSCLVLSTVNSMPQFSEKQIESLAFIRLNPCERAIWR